MKKKLYLHPTRMVDVGVNKIKTNPNTLKIQTEEKVAFLIQCIEEMGLLRTIFVDENYIILDGHAVYLAAEALGFKKIPVLLVEGMREREKELFMYAACKTAHMLQWNYENIRNPWEVHYV